MVSLVSVGSLSSRLAGGEVRVLAIEEIEVPINAGVSTDALVMKRSRGKESYSSSGEFEVMPAGGAVMASIGTEVRNYARVFRGLGDDLED